MKKLVKFFWRHFFENVTVMFLDYADFSSSDAWRGIRGREVEMEEDLRSREAEMEDLVKLTALPEGVYVMTLTGDGEHRLNPKSVAAIQAALDKVEGDPNSKVLVTTNEGRFFSNGIDPDFLDMSHRESILSVLHELLARFLHFPLPTVASINGHAVAGGCMLALAHDYRYMRSDKGFIFLNEMDIKIPLTPGMDALIRSKLPVHTYHKAVLSGYRFTAKEAEISGFLDAALPDTSSTQQEALRQAFALAKRNFDRATYKAMKGGIFKEEIRILRSGTGVPSSRL